MTMTMIDEPFTAPASVKGEKITLDFKSIMFDLDQVKYKLSYTDLGFYLLYKNDEERPFRCGYLWKMVEDDDGQPYIELMERVPDAPGDYGDGFDDYYRYYPKAGVLTHWHDQ
jgi:hypothetical protein